MEAGTKNHDGAPKPRAAGNRMDYEQYLYGPVAQDEADRASPWRCKDGIARLAFTAGAAVGALVVLVIAAAVVSMRGDGRMAFPASEKPPATADRLPMTVAVSQGAAVTPRR